MIADAHRIVALMPVFGDVSPMGVAAAHEAPFGGMTVTEHAIRRLARCKHVDRIVVLQRRGAASAVMPDDPATQKRVVVYEVDASLTDGDMQRPARITARKWSPTAWRGGLGGATVFDEPLCARAMVEAMQAIDATAGLIVSADWPVIDPALCDAVIERHRREAEKLKLVFTQAAPGLCGALVGRGLMEELASTGASVGSLLAYTPRLPQADPIGKDPCVQVDPSVRDARCRFTFDAPRWQRVLRAVESAISATRLMEADAKTLASAAQGEAARRAMRASMPQQVTIELTNERGATGPITPQHHVDLPSEAMSVDTARALIDQLAAEPDVAVTFGALGDALRHEHWEAIVEHAASAGVFGVHVRTDLHVDEATLARLIELPIDVVSVNLPADTAATYEALMGCDAFARVTGNLQWLLNARLKAGRGGLPWIVPRLAKMAANIGELESFFDRWVYYAGAAVIEAPPTCAGPKDAGAAMPDLAVIDMAPPRRRACRQLEGRMTVLADGRVALCDQDWRGEGVNGCASTHGGGVAPLGATWAAMEAMRERHEAGDVEALPLCAGCSQWHRP